MFHKSCAPYRRLVTEPGTSAVLNSRGAAQNSSPGRQPWGGIVLGEPAPAGAADQGISAALPGLEMVQHSDPRADVLGYTVAPLRGYRVPPVSSQYRSQS